MGFRHGVTLEAVLIPALFLTHLTVPAQLLKPFGLHPIGQVLDASFLRLGHFGGILAHFTLKRILVEFLWTVNHLISAIRLFFNITKATNDF